MIKQKLLILLCFSFFYSCVSPKYYGINDFGSLEFIDNEKFYYHLFDVGNDTGKYYIVGDTIFLTSSVQPVNYIQDEISFFSDTSMLLTVNMKVFEKRGVLFKDGEFSFQDGNLLIDTILKIDIANKVYVNNFFLYEGQLVVFDFYGKYKYVVPKDTVCSGYFKLNRILGKRAYFDNYPLLMRDNYLLPFDEEANDYFRKINGFEFFPMKKRNKNKNYKTYLSGFGKIH